MHSIPFYSSSNSFSLIFAYIEWDTDSILKSSESYEAANEYIRSAVYSWLRECKVLSKMVRDLVSLTNPLQFLNRFDYQLYDLK